MPDYIGEHIDRLITTELKNRGMPHDFLIELYEVARKEAGGRPLTTLAAEGLVRSVGKGDTVFLMTGAGYPPHMPKGESDGPPGAAALARALYWGLGAVPVYVCEENHADPIIASSEAAHLMVKDFADARDLRLGAAIATAPPDGTEVAGWAKTIYDECRPKALISIERLGPNEHGFLNSATGWTIGEETGIIDLAPIVTEAEERGVFSIGTGDHGNEIGFGRIHDDVKRIMPQGAKGQSDTPGGMATVLKADVLIPAMMSNWGAYGVEAALAFLLKKPELVHSPAMERDIVTKCLEAGGLEAMYCSTRFAVDGCDGESSMAIVQLLGDMVRLNLRDPDVGVAH
jgi:hypothetical protein